MASQKEQFHEKGQIYQASELLFDVPNSQLLTNYSVVECNNFIAYGSADCRDPAPYGVFDPQLGFGVFTFCEVQIHFVANFSLYLKIKVVRDR